MKRKQITLSLIKPDAIINNYTGVIIDIILKNNFYIKKINNIILSKKKAKEFYKEHQSKLFFKSLINFMTSSYIIIMILQKADAVNSLREIIGNTDPKKADINTIRNKYGTSIIYNAIHGSDSIKSAKREISFFYPKIDLLY